LTEWVNQLTVVDKRVAGLKDFEWNETVTTEQKHIERVRKLADVENQKKKRKLQKERDQKRRELDELRKVKDAERDAIRQERE